MNMHRKRDALAEHIVAALDGLRIKFNERADNLISKMKEENNSVDARYFKMMSFEPAIKRDQQLLMWNRPREYRDGIGERSVIGSKPGPRRTS